MNIILILVLTLAVAMTAVTILNKRNLIRLRDDLTVLQEKLNEREKEKALLEEERHSLQHPWRITEEGITEYASFSFVEDSYYK
jgi:cell division protein FtsL